MFEIADALDAWSINLSGDRDAERLRAITDNGYRSLVYTVNDPTLAKRLQSDGAAGSSPTIPTGCRRFARNALYGVSSSDASSRCS